MTHHDALPHMSGIRARAYMGDYIGEMGHYASCVMVAGMRRLARPQRAGAGESQAAGSRTPIRAARTHRSNENSPF